MQVVAAAARQAAGTRSAAAWANVQTRQGRSADEVLEAGDKAGYDLRAWLV